MMSDQAMADNQLMADSRLMVGVVQHRRFSPVIHSLSYPIFMPLIDLDELEMLQQKVWGFGSRWWHWARFRREDYLGDGDLKTDVQNKVAELTGEQVGGKVVMACHLRYLGLYFSPVNFFYLYDEKGVWRYLLAEVSNTPWNERHYYAINADSGESNINWSHQKAFHVSPFNPMQQQYKWMLKPLSQRLFIHLECHKVTKNHEETKKFDATLVMKARAFSSANLLKLLIITPIQTVKIVTGIYWHALKLWIKKVPIYDHPGHCGQSTQHHQENNLKDENNKESSSC